MKVAHDPGEGSSSGSAGVRGHPPRPTPGTTQPRGARQPPAGPPRGTAVPRGGPPSSASDPPRAPQQKNRGCGGASVGKGGPTMPQTLPDPPPRNDGTL